MAKETSAFVRKLAHNDPAIRKSAFAALTKYLQSPSGQKLRFHDLEKLWKGLYYSMWFCDKPIPQQNLAGDLGELFAKTVPQNKLADFHRAFWAVLMREWHSIDKWRLDKFLMLVRRAVRNSFFRLAEHQWPQLEVSQFLAVLEEYPLSNNVKFPQSLAYHVCDIYLDEIEYVIFKDFRDYSEENDDDEESESEDESGDDAELPAKSTPKAPKPSLGEKETEARKADIIAQTPVSLLLGPFEKLASGAKNKAMRSKVKEEILEDSRVLKWTGAEPASSDSEDEWTGF
ncbi:nucleolar [Metschnikowia bicuspidata var. bicuspidata NRRL YB-4993]|uniref:Nucleolar n=1 Tax=Metschnikowia bicuspidata var. bicuspidata NRRL YB-4993 TaxID=869754 RepID=A0A1A0HF68_9ASCO|nr:nucleolar [Metschnikowia bicuspidata var. bicuspidata NRRL YB-4993]OBA22779.1 nucleolar [Metschnikowia bicuspidata var. bicuspidata NRRL YB-4993]